MVGAGVLHIVAFKGSDLCVCGRLKMFILDFLPGFSFSLELREWCYCAFADL